jgi:hypothetical protein
MLGFEIADGLRNISIAKNIKPIADRPIRTDKKTYGSVMI